jgi:hypothetical protein
MPRAAVRLVGVPAVLLLLMVVTQLGHCGVRPHHSESASAASAVLTSADHGPGHRGGPLCHLVAAEQLSSSPNHRPAPGTGDTTSGTGAVALPGLLRGHPGDVLSAPPLMSSGRTLLVTLGVARS